MSADEFADMMMTTAVAVTLMLFMWLAMDALTVLLKPIEVTVEALVMVAEAAAAILTTGAAETGTTAAEGTDTHWVVEVGLLMLGLVMAKQALSDITRTAGTGPVVSPSIGLPELTAADNPYSVRDIGVRRRVVESSATVGECVNCGIADVRGVVRTAVRERVAFGVVYKSETMARNHECVACNRAHTAEYAARRLADEPAHPDEIDEYDDGLDLTLLKHVGAETAKELRDAGYETVEDVQAADAAALQEVPYIGEQTARELSQSADALVVE